MKIRVNKLFIIIVNLLLISILPVNEIFAGAWTQKKGTSYYKADFRYLGGNKWYDPNGDKLAIPDFKDITVGVFGSYGITDNLTLMLNAAAFKSVKLDTNTSTLGFDNEVSGFGDILVGGKYKLAKFGQSFISGKLLINLPTGESSPDGGLWTGSGDYHQTIGLEYGYSFWPTPAYISAGVTYTNRTQGFSDEFRYGIEAGYTFIKDLSLILRFHGQVSMKNGDPNVKGGFGVYSNDQQYIAYNAELAYKLSDNFGVKGYYESGGAGKNIISAPVINVGLFFTN
ncbi:MAG: transporter [Ignavibacteriaceae bacterium]|nr:transporter [Ignavibacteriaceae bacterium]